MSNKADDSFAVVLVETTDNLNIGATARAMKNLGFSDLRLVKPLDYQPKRAKITACTAVDVLEGQQIFQSLEAALADVQYVVGFSARDGRNRVTYSLPHWTEQISKDELKKVALVFGPEDNGLRMEHIEHCRHLVYIPSNDEYSSFNLAQAVLLVLYSIRQAFPLSGEAKPARALPSGNDYYQLDRLIENTLTLSGFYRPGTPAPIPGIIKSLFRRLSPDEREMGILMGLFARIERVLAGRSPVYRDDQ